MRPDIFTIYLFPNSFEQAVQKVKDRNLKKQEEKVRIEKALKEFDFVKNNVSFLEKFDIVATNTYVRDFVVDIITKIEKLK